MWYTTRNEKGFTVELVIRIFLFECTESSKWILNETNGCKFAKHRLFKFSMLLILDDWMFHTNPLFALNCIFSILKPIFSCLVPRMVCISSKLFKIFDSGTNESNLFHWYGGNPIQIFCYSNNWESEWPTLVHWIVGHLWEESGSHRTLLEKSFATTFQRGKSFKMELKSDHRV